MIGMRVSKRRRKATHLVLLMGVFVIVGCGSGETPALDIQVTDSAGIRVVHVPPLSTLDLPEVRLHRAFSTRNLDGGRIELFRVRDGLFLKDGSLVITNSGTSEVIIFDSDGKGTSRAGRQGRP